MTIIGFIGNKGAGKDTLADYLVDNYNYIKYNFANPIKDIAEILFDLKYNQLNIDKEQIDSRWNLSPRTIFQRLGTEFGQDMIYELFPELNDKIKKKHFWLKHFEVFLEKNKNKNIVIADIRFLHEIEFLVNNNNNNNNDINKCILIKIVNTKNNIDIDRHISENEISKIDLKHIDFIINNNSSKEELYSKFNNLINNNLIN
jgi:dephospho-CoA kinase